MKKFKNLMLMLAFALFFVGAMNVTKASAATATPKYDKEYIEITGASKQVYYQVVKSATPGDLKPANWIPAALDDSKYYIDFSATANGKDAYIAWTEDNAAKTGSVVTIDAKVKSVKVNLNYATEELAETPNLDEIIKTVTVKGVESTEDKQDVSPAKYVFLWKRGANGNWKNETEFSQLEWDMVRASNATLYISVAGGNGTDNATPASDVYAYRVSKEAKVKIPKAAKAPTVKLDYAKGTVALKNGMQVKLSTVDAWTTVLPYSKLDSVTETKIFGNADEVTKTKVSGVTIDALLEQLEVEEQGAEIKLNVRTAATDKKFPSNTATVELTTPAAGNGCTNKTFTYYVAEPTANVKAELIIDFAQIINNGTAGEYDKFEYILLKGNADVDKVDYMKQKWTKVPADGKLNLSSKIDANSKYVAAGVKDPVQFKNTEIGVILVRNMGDKSTEKFPSITKVVTVTLEKALTYAITLPTVASVTGLEDISYKVGTGKATKAKEGETVTLAMELAEGYTVKSVKAGDRNATLTEDVYSFTMPKADVTVTVELNAPANDGGDAGDGTT